MLTTVESIRTSNSDNKTSEYLQLANSLTVRAYELAGNSSFLSRFVKDMEKECAKSPDNEYTAYRVAIKVEAMYTNLEGFKSGRLKLSDLI